MNSARSVMDHISSEEVEVFPLYFDTKKRVFRISNAQLYSNTPSDFDFKLKKEEQPLREKELLNFLRSLDIVFSVMHGPFGEDGKIQRFLERNDIPFVGAGSEACKKAFDKFKANRTLQKNGFFTLPSCVLGIYGKNHQKTVKDFFVSHDIKRAVVKPANGGSSIGVFSVSTPEEALERANLLFSKRMDTRVVLEPFADGVEFTMIILQNKFGSPVALPPTEIETDYTENQIFDFRKKYLPTRQVKWHCPPRFSKETIERMQAQAEQIFSLFDIKDFGRFDGWVFEDGNIWFCDLNPVSGMEQNSFLFQQASRTGMTHSEVLSYITKSACRRYGIHFPERIEKPEEKRKRVNILMGGKNSERQVSLMSGTNVWLKLRNSRKYDPHPFLLDTEDNIWELPYHLCLNHTVEEVAENCEEYERAKKKLGEFEDRSRLRLGIESEKDQKEFFSPKKKSMEDLCDESSFFFIALHGGEGENGELQRELTKKGVDFNGPDEEVSELCMDKWRTSRYIDELGIKGVRSIPGKLVRTEELMNLDDTGIRKFWRRIRENLKAKTVIVKPSADGCSSGIVHLYSSNDLQEYLFHLQEKVPFIEKNTFRNQLSDIEMPTEIPEEFIFEKFMKTDTLRVRANELKHERRTGLIEITIGVVEKEEGLKAFHPSITVVENEVLTVEEKFQGGTGVNITPPPYNLVPKKVLRKVKRRTEKLASELEIKGYSRIDAFLETDTGDLFIIEINTLPGLTPSTVLYHQALAEKPPIFPRELLEMIIENKETRF